MKRSLATLILMTMVACGTQRATPVAVVSSLDITQQLQTYLDHPYSTAEVADLRSVSISQYYQALLNTTSDDSVAIGQQVVGRAHSILANAGPLFAVLQARYGSVGELLAASAGSSPSLAGIASGLAGVADAYRDIETPTGGAVVADSLAMRNFAALETLVSTFGTRSQSALGLVGSAFLPSASSVPGSLNTRCQSGGSMYLINYKPPANFGLGHSATYFKGNAALGIQSFFQNYPRTGVLFNPPPIEEVTNASGKPVNPEDIEIYHVGEVPPDTARALVDKLQNPPDPYTYDTANGTNYHLVLSNCAQRSLSVLQEAGFDVPPVVLTPVQLAKIVAGS